MTDQPLFERGRMIGPNYRVVRCIGRGGMGRVYEVTDSEGRHRAVKVFAAERGNVEFLKRRFWAEGRILSRLSHPRLVHVLEVGVDDATHAPFFVMNLVLDAQGEPTTLEDVRTAGKVSEAVAWGWYEDLRSALDYCHANGIAHRDVKLNNVLLDANGRAVLSDFGISRAFDPEVRHEMQVTTTFIEGETTGTRPVMGTFWYLAPELRRGGEATAASDWYALGVLLFRLLTGMWYESGTDALELLAPYDRRWRTLLARLLSDDPAMRTPPPAAAPRPCHRRFVFGVCALLAAGLLVWLVMPHRCADSVDRRTFVLDATNRFEFCRCPPGTNSCGAVAVTLTRPYYLATTPVTRRQWFALRCAALDAWPGGEDAPMTYVSRDEVTNFIARLNQRFADELPKDCEFRLPTLAEWRLAYAQGHTCADRAYTNRAEQTQRRLQYEAVGWYGQGAVSGDPRQGGMWRFYADRRGAMPMTKEIWPDFPPRPIHPGRDDWMRYSSQVAPVPVAQKSANDLGLFDMCGNCCERTHDRCGEGAFSYMRNEFGINTCDLYRGQGVAVTNPVEASGEYPLMVGTYVTPDFAGDVVWTSQYDRMPHLGFRLCIGHKLED